MSHALRRTLRYYYEGRFEVEIVGILFDRIPIIYLESQSQHSSAILLIEVIETFSEIQLSSHLILALGELIKKILTCPEIFFVGLKSDYNNNANLREKTCHLPLKKEVLIRINQGLSDFHKRHNSAINLRDFIKLKRRLPLGRYNLNNSLNDLTGREWLKFTKSWFIENPKPRTRLEKTHPAKFPESLISDFILFFTKKGNWVLDPFLGSGSTLISCLRASRNAIGIEINPEWVKIAKDRIKKYNANRSYSLDNFFNLNSSKSVHSTKKIEIICEDARKILNIWQNRNFPKIDYCITSPPYWNQLKNSSIRQRKRKIQDLPTNYGIDPLNLENIDVYDRFIEEQRKIFKKIKKITRPGGYLTIITNNLSIKGKTYPLAFDTALSVGRDWDLMDEKIWCQDNKPLLVLGIHQNWYSNRCHQYCLIFKNKP